MGLPAFVVVVHDDPSFLQQATAAIADAGHDVVGFADPIAALDAIEAGQRFHVLVTRIRFPKGKPNGVALALMSRYKRPGSKVIFTARPEYEQHAKDIGEFMPMPINLPNLVEAVARLVRCNSDELPSAGDI